MEYKNKLNGVIIILLAIIYIFVGVVTNFGSFSTVGIMYGVPILISVLWLVYLIIWGYIDKYIKYEIKNSLVDYVVSLKGKIESDKPLKSALNNDLKLYDGDYKEIGRTTIYNRILTYIMQKID